MNPLCHYWTSATYQSIDIFVVGISRTPGFSEAKDVFKFSKFLFNFLLIFKHKIEKASFSEEFNSAVVLSILKYLVCSLGTEESLTQRKCSELNELKLRLC